jgi:hypothetical protein
MRTIIFIILVISAVPSFGQRKIGLINNATLSTSRTIKSATIKDEILNVPIIYTVHFKITDVSGYPKMNCKVIASGNGKDFYPLKEFLVTEDNKVWDDGKWDTIIMETTPFSIYSLGIEVEAIDSTQNTKHNHDLIITPYNLFEISLTQ